jgi:hypothetical protein
LVQHAETDEGRALRCSGIDVIDVGLDHRETAVDDPEEGADVQREDLGRHGVVAGGGQFDGLGEVGGRVVPP